MQVALAPKCLQVALHQDSGGKRLHRFLELILSINANISVAWPSDDELARCLDQTDLLICPTRQKRFPYREAEIDVIERFVRNPSKPGHLMVLSNHFPLTVQDSRLSCRFGFTFPHSAFTGRDRQSNIILNRTPEEPHRITRRMGNEGRILEVEVRNCSCILPCWSEGTTLYFLAPGMVDRTANHIEASSKIFAYVIDAGGDQRGPHGRIAALADSGLIGEPMDDNPGPGLDVSDNFGFIRNLVRWLLYGDRST